MDIQLGKCIPVLATLTIAYLSPISLGCLSYKESWTLVRLKVQDQLRNKYPCLEAVLELHFEMHH